MLTPDEPSTDDLKFLLLMLNEKEQELRVSRIVYLKPWPEWEGTTLRLQKWVKKKIHDRSLPEKITGRG